MTLKNKAIHILLLSKIMIFMACNSNVDTSPSSYLEKKSLLYDYVSSFDIKLDKNSKVAIVLENTCKNCVKMLIDTSFINDVGYTLIYIKSSNFEPMYTLPANTIIDIKSNYYSKTKESFKETVIIYLDSIHIINQNNITCNNIW